MGPLEILPKEKQQKKKIEKTSILIDKKPQKEKQLKKKNN